MTILLDVPAVFRLNGTDVDGEVLTFSASEGREHGQLEDLTNWHGQFATVRYSPDPEFAGEDGFSFIASDGLSDSNVGQVSVLVEDVVGPVEEPPISVQLVPWVEVNACRKPEWIDHCMEGLLIRSRVTDMRIIPGTKSCPRMERIDSVEGWSEVAVDVEATMIIYPGFKRWPDAAYPITDLLLEPSS